MSRDIKLVTLALFLWGCGEGLFIYIMPLYMEQLGATPSEVGAVLGWNDGLAQWQAYNQSVAPLALATKAQFSGLLVPPAVSVNLVQPARGSISRNAGER